MNRSWLKVWIIAIALTATLVLGYEGFLRSRAYVPTVQDDADLWSQQFDLVKSDPHAVALLGASRIQFAVDPVLLSQLLGGRTVAMLAVNGNYPLATLRFLAEDTNFAGLAIVGIDSRGMWKRHWNMQQSQVAHYRDRWTSARKIHRTIESWLQQHLVVLRAPFSAANVLRRQLEGHGLPFNDYVVMRPDRLGFLDYRRTDVGAIKVRRLADLETYYKDNPPPAADVWLSDLDEVSGWLKKIQDRGGRVVFFREPVSDEHFDLDEHAYPRPQYWDEYARIAPAMLIDFRDEPLFAGFKLPDSSHIDGDAVPAFTIALARMLAERKMVPPLSMLPDSVIPVM